MKIISQLQKALNEADEGILTEEFRIASEDSYIVFNGKLDYTGDSKIALELSLSMPNVIKHYLSESQYNDLSEDQFKGASDKIKKALEEVSSEFEQSLRNKLASYGLKEGEDNG